jgi:hypothetical protein
MTKAERQYRSILKLSADTRAKLRPVDVDRVMSEAHSQGCLEGFRVWVQEQASERTMAEVIAWSLE